jgi:hypothetical protein
MNDEVHLTDESLEKRIKLGLIPREELRARSEYYWSLIQDNRPIEINGVYGCPVCSSKLSKDNRLVRGKGYIVCDYCVNFIEGYD